MASQHRSVIVTGASKGIGAAVAKRLAQDGYAVVINYAGDKAAADLVVTEIERSGGRAIAVQGDVSDPAVPAALFDAGERAFGRVDALVNNAGTMPTKLLVDVSDEEFDRIVAVNLKGVFNGLREAARRLPDGGRIVSFSTGVVGLSPPTYSVYAATKAGVEALTRILSKELGPRGITVNVVAPGPTDTALYRTGKSEETIAQNIRAIPLGRLGTPEDAAAATSFLLGPDGSWVNGQVLRANGGMI